VTHGANLLFILRQRSKPFDPLKTRVARMAGRRPRIGRRRPCPECGARAVLVRYEPVLNVPVAVRTPVELRCSNKACARYWR
jgi:hypothetical protein